MRTSSSSTRNIAIVIIIVVLIGVIYFYFEGGSVPSTSSLLQPSDSAGTVGSSELALLNQIQSLKIDTSLFADSAYLTLQDYSVQVPPENVGRANPFAPIPGVAIPAH